MPYRIFLKIENVKNQSHFLSFLSEKDKKILLTFAGRNYFGTIKL